MSKPNIGVKNPAAGVVGILMLIASEPALAWDGVVAGTIHALDVTQGENYGFRVYLNGVGSNCTGGANWSYINESDSNYKTFVAVLMMAKAQEAQVTIYTNLQNGYCRIGYITLS